MSEWQPILTAYDDEKVLSGRAVLVANGIWQTVAVLHRHRGIWVSNGPAYVPYPADEQPTHWQHLGAPPND